MSQPAFGRCLCRGRAATSPCGCPVRFLMIRKERASMVDDSAWLQPLPSATRLSFCGDETAQHAALVALGLPSSMTPCRAVSTGARASLWLGPDERLLLAPAGERSTLLAILGNALAGHAHSLVDISHRQLAF